MSERASIEAGRAPVAIVTGAAGDIGRAITLRLLNDGMCVIACDLDENNLRQAYAGSATPADRLALCTCDVTRREDAVRVVDVALSTWGRVDALVNNAATVTPTAAVGDLDPADWQHTLDVNLTGAWNMTCAVLSVMTKAGRGVVLNVASQLGHVAAPGRGAYSVSKAGLIALTRAIAADYASHGIRAVSLSPGPVLTSRVARRYASAEQAVATLAPRVPAGRLGTPEEIAAAAAFLLGDGAGFMLGTDLLMDGGYTIV
jgi:NAD(P)-dependent dehydrogenase (short-subunit alcohol dehydrogenase family)